LWGEKDARLASLLTKQRNPNYGSPRVSDELVDKIKSLSKSGAGRWCGGKHEQVAEMLGWEKFETCNLFGKNNALQMTAFIAFCAVYGVEDEFRWLWDSELLWDEVVEVQPAGPCKIYDLTVPATSCFVANDVVVHNTWCAAILSHKAWVDGNKVLFATTEISKMRIAMRFCALHFNLPYKDVRTAKLDAFVEKKWRDGIQDILTAEGLYVIGGDFDFRPENYENAIEEVQDEEDYEEGKILSVFDGAYLLRTEGKNRIERAANAFDELKRICKRTGVPNVVTMQFNREVKANQAESVSTEKIALTDVASWNADLIYALIQTEDMKSDKRMIFKPLKTREYVGEELEMLWDLDNMKFEELEKEGGGYGAEENPFDSGIDPGASDDAPF